jgi:hypothetical protein
LIFSGSITGTVLSWSDDSWIISNVTKKENIPENMFCKIPSRKNFFIFPEMRTPMQGESLCASYGT